MNKILILAALVSFSAVLPLAAQDQNPANLTELTPAEFIGSLQCSRCHEKPSRVDINSNVPDFVWLEEYRIWLNHDPHARAYLSIIPDEAHFKAILERFPKPEGGNDLQLPQWGESNDRSKLMLQRMFGDQYDQQIGKLFAEMTQLQQSQESTLKKEQFASLTPRLKETLQQCLSCHAGWDKRQSDFDFEFVTIGTGVSCESCHGASSQWFDEHVKPTWRKMDPREKSAQYGMNDVRNPIVRTEQCYSCHVGNVEQGKVVTHEMYAAGHPPLPGIEIESFADQLPRHWRYISEKPDFEFAEEFKKHYGFDLESKQSIPWGEGEFPRTKNLLVGGVMAAAHSVDLLADSASDFTQLRQSVGANVAMAETNNWPEFAAFDCAACHHDLKGDGRKRGFAGVPGRPAAPYWPRVISRLGLAYLSAQHDGSMKDEFLASQQKLQATLDRQPFGDPVELSELGSEYARWLKHEAANSIQSKTLTQDDAKLVLQLLCGGDDQAFFNPEDESWDFHSARQLGWAINQVYSEWMGTKVRKDAPMKDLTANFDTPFGKLIVEMREQLMLELPVTGEITTHQVEYLTAWRDFDREQFFEMLGQLRSALER